VSIAFNGEVHPAAAVWPMLSEAELRRLADHIAANGLLSPIVLDSEGRVLDGRNRLAACVIAGVQPEFVVHEGDPVEVVLGSNNERRHSSLPVRAAATALTLATNRRRENGRWKRGSVPDAPDNQESLNNWRNLMADAGLVIDHAPELLPKVVAGDIALDAAAKTASQIRETKKRRGEVPDDLGALVDAGELSLDDALRRAVLPEQYEARVAVGELSLDEAEQLAQQADRERADAVRRQVAWIADFLRGWDTVAHFGVNPLRDEVLDAMSDHDRDRLLAIEKEVIR